jgi:hypothetical protein
MKLKIKEKDYNELLQYKEKYEEQLYRANGLSYLCDNYLVEINKLRETRDNALLNFKTRKCLVGGKGIGKTHFIKTQILPYISNYLVLDFNNEYKDIKTDKHKSVICHISREKSNIIDLIKSYPNRLIIIEDANILNSTRGLRWLFDELNNNYILVYQAFENIKNITDKFDYIYDFDTNEQDSIKLDFRTNYNDKIIQI